MQSETCKFRTFIECLFPNIRNASCNFNALQWRIHIKRIWADPSCAIGDYKVSDKFAIEIEVCAMISITWIVTKRICRCIGKFDLAPCGKVGYVNRLKATRISRYGTTLCTECPSPNAFDFWPYRYGFKVTATAESTVPYTCRWYGDFPERITLIDNI